MRPISSELAAVQRVRSPRARVTVTAATRGQNPEAPAVGWEPLVENTGQSVFQHTALISRSDGTVLRFVVLPGTGIVRYAVTDPTTAAGWAAPSPVTVRSHGVLSMSGLRLPGSSTTMRLFYIHTNNNVYYIQSTNGGVTFGSPVLVYGGGDAVGDVVVGYLNDGVVANGPWFVGFSTYDASTGLYRARFGTQVSGVWTTWAYATGWRAAGIDVYAPAAAVLRVLVFRQMGQGASRLRMLDLSGSGVYSNPQELDQTQGGSFGLQLSFYRFHQLPDVGCLMGVAHESAAGRGNYLGVSGLFTRPDVASNPAADVRVVDEPVMLPSIVHPRNLSYVGMAATGNGDVYLAGDVVVYRGVAQSAPGSLPEPVSYRYDENVMEINFPSGTAGLAVGQRLSVTRTLSWGSQSGSESIGVYVVRVERGTRGVRVVGVDGLGMLGLMRCRRPVIVNDGSAAGVAQALRRLAGRVGLPLRVDRLSLESGSVLPATIAPNESLRSAAYRVGSQVEGYLVPANDGSLGLTLIGPPVSVSGDYVDAAHVYGVAGELWVTDAAEVSDYRELAFSYVLGSYSTDPEDGAAVGMAAGPVLPNTRPMSYSLTNMRYNTYSRVEAAAAAEAARQKMNPVRAEMETPANLGLELYDVVEVTEPRLGWVGKRWRVRRISEMYERGRLVQHVWLGEV